MASLKEVKTRISSVISTQQITNAMKMVAAAKLRKSQDRIIQNVVWDFDNFPREIINDIAARGLLLGHISKSIANSGDQRVSYGPLVWFCRGGVLRKCLECGKCDDGNEAE